MPKKLLNFILAVTIFKNTVNQCPCMYSFLKAIIFVFLGNVGFFFVVITVCTFLINNIKLAVLVGFQSYFHKWFSPFFSYCIYSSLPVLLYFILHF